MKAGRIFVALLFGVGVVGVLVTGAAIYSRFLYLSILLVVGFWVWTRWVARGLRLSRSARILRANVGDFFEEHFEVVNGSRVIAPWIEVFNQIHNSLCIRVAPVDAGAWPSKADISCAHLAHTTRRFCAWSHAYFHR